MSPDLPTAPTHPGTPGATTRTGAPRTSSPRTSSEPLVEVRNLSVDFATVDGQVHAVRDVSFTVESGEGLGIVGESGSGKTVSVLAMMGLLAGNARVRGGQIRYRGEDLLQASGSRMRSLRGKQISMIFQDPMTALDPVERISKQIGQTIEYHDRKASRQDVRRRVLAVLESVGVPDVERRANQYPHQWSGGMRQRAVIAMALVNEPDLIIADEPTTALDATVQAQVLEVLHNARRDRDCALIMISHDLGVVSEVTDRVLVMYAGTLAETATTQEIFAQPRHPYTRALIRARPSWGGARDERLFTIAGRPPDLLDVPPGCPFEPRCVESDGLPACQSTVPPRLEIGSPEHLSACHRAHELPDLDELSTKEAS